MAFNYKLLKLRILEIFDSQENFARQLGVSNVALSRKLNNKIRLSQQDIILWAKLLDIPSSEYKKYFFTLEVQDN